MEIFLTSTAHDEAHQGFIALFCLRFRAKTSSFFRSHGVNNGFFPSFAVQGCDHFPFSIIINGQSKVIMSRARPTTTEDIRIFFAKMTCLIGAKEETTSQCLKITEKVSKLRAKRAKFAF